MPNTLYSYPEVEITGQIYNRATLMQHVQSYEKLHGTTPYCLVSGYMEKKDETLLYCDHCHIADARGQWFTVCHELGTFAVKVPEHEQITVLLTLNSEA